MNDRNSVAIRVGVAFLIAIRLLSLPTYADDGKQPIPNVVDLKQKVDLVAEVYKPDYEAAQTASDKVELAKRMILEGDATNRRYSGEVCAVPCGSRYCGSAGRSSDCLGRD